MHRNGFTLVEVLVVVAIAAIVIMVVGNFGTNIAGLNQLVSLELGAKSTINQTLQGMTEEVRSASVSAAGAYPIESAGTSSFIFYSDINKNGGAERIRYFYATSTIYKGVIAPSGTPATYPTSSEVLTIAVQNVSLSSSTPLFSYYGATYSGSQAPLASPVPVAAVRLVGIAFSVVTARTSTAGTNVQTFSNLIDLRNLDSN